MMFGFSKYTGSPSRPQEQQADTELQQEKRYHPDPTHGPTATQINQGRPFNCLSGGNEYDLVRDGAHFIKTVEWEMLDKRKFFPMSMMSSFTVRCFLYPLTLIRTRLQVQKGKEMYSGTYDAGRKILQNEGIRGLYRGFFVSAFQIVSGLCYGNFNKHVLKAFSNCKSVILAPLPNFSKLGTNAFVHLFSFNI